MANIYNSQLVSYLSHAPTFIPSVSDELQDAFDLYHKFQESTSQSSALGDGSALPALGHALAGSTGAAISNVCTYPLELIITRLQVQRHLRRHFSSPRSTEYSSVPDAVRKIYADEGGVKGFYTGVLQDTGKTVADAFLFFLAYNFLRTRRLKNNSSKSSALPVLDELTVGFLAGSFAKLITTPIANIVTRKQTSALMSTDTSKSETVPSSPTTKEIAAQIRSEKGLIGFWSGYSASLILTLNPSLTFFLYETFKRLLLPRSKRDTPPPAVTFLLAAISKAIASTITYPFSLAKARLQTVSTNPKTDPTKDTSSSKPSSPPPHRPNPLHIFTTVHAIYQNDGPLALYEGLPAEITKGFFSHGITMIIKESIHKFIIRLYYLLSRAIASGTSAPYSYLSATKLAADAQARTEELASRAKTALLHTTAVATARATAEVEHAKGGVEGVRDWVMESANETAELVKDYVGNGEEDEDGEWFDVWWWGGWGHKDGEGKG
jgi:hypothetical protein